METVSRGRRYGERVRGPVELLAGRRIPARRSWAVALCRDQGSETAGRSVCGRRNSKTLCGSHKRMELERQEVAGMAAGKGGIDRSVAPCAEERVGGRRNAMWPIWRQRGVAAFCCPRPQRAHRFEADRTAGTMVASATEAAAVPDLLFPWQAGSPCSAGVVKGWPVARATRRVEGRLANLARYRLEDLTDGFRRALWLPLAEGASRHPLRARSSHLIGLDWPYLAKPTLVSHSELAAFPASTRHQPMPCHGRFATDGLRAGRSRSSAACSGQTWASLLRGLVSARVFVLSMNNEESASTMKP